MELNNLSHTIIGAAIEVHRRLCVSSIVFLQPLLDCRNSVPDDLPGASDKTALVVSANLQTMLALSFVSSSSRARA